MSPYGAPNGQALPPAPRAPVHSAYAPNPHGQNPGGATPPPPQPQAVQPSLRASYAAPPAEAITPAAGRDTPKKARFSFNKTKEAIQDAKVGNVIDALGKKRKIFTAMSLAFLLAFIMIVGSVMIQSQRADHDAGLILIKQNMTQRSQSASDRIGQAVRWQDMALSSRAAPSQVVGFAARGTDVIGVAVVDANGRVLSHYPAQAKALSQVSLENFPQSGIRITGLPGQGGVVSPLIIRRSGDVYLITQLTPGSLLGENSSGAEAAIIAQSGEIIDATPSVANKGVASAFSLSQSNVQRLASIEKGVGTSPLPGGSLLAVTRIPNSDLTLLRNVGRATVGTTLPIWPFVLLFLSTAGLIFGLLRLLSSRLKHETDAHNATHQTQARFRKAVEGGRGGIFEINLQNQTLFINEELSENLGLPRQEHRLTTSQFLGLVQAEDRERLLSAIRRSHIQGEFNIDVRAAQKAVVMQFRGGMATDPYSGESILSGIVNDITEQRGAQTRLQLAEARLYDALNTMTNSFVIWDKMRRLVLWNGKFEDFFGFAPGQLQQGMEQSIVEQLAHRHIENIFYADDDASIGENVLEIKLKDGRWIRYAEGDTADGGQVSIGNEVTELREREEQLRANDATLRNTVDVLRKSQSRIMELADSYEQEKIRAEQASQSKSDFLANMSHELRTPLNAINGFSDIMKREMFGPLGDPRYKEYVSDILFSGQHLLSLINDILDMSKIEAGKMNLNTDSILVSDMVAQVIRILRGRAEDNRLKLVYDHKQIKAIEADPRAIKQVLLNLMTNAIKFTPEGGTVKIDIEEKTAGLIIRVIDSGIGIAQEDIDRLAKPFEQVDKAASKQTEGTGLGLALSKSLIELHGGNFLITSEVGKGTTVTFTLPNRPPERNENAKDNEVGVEINRLAADIATALSQNPDAPPPAPIPVQDSADAAEPEYIEAYPEETAPPPPAAQYAQSAQHPLPPPPPMAARG